MLTGIHLRTLLRMDQSISNMHSPFGKDPSAFIGYQTITSKQKLFNGQRERNICSHLVPIDDNMQVNVAVDVKVPLVSC